MQWYYSKNATQMGPVPEDALRAKLAAGEVVATDMVWREGMPDWRPASTMAELHGIQQANPAISQPPRIPDSADASPAIPDSGHGLVRTSGLAIASLVCGIAGLFCLFLPSIAAVICGHMALTQISDSKVPMGGRGLAIAGLVLGYLSIAITVFGILVMVLTLPVIPSH